MRSLRIACLAMLVAAVQGESPRPNVLLLCVDDLRPELGCYGVDHIRSPNIDRLAGQGAVFRRHYVQAPTCGASRYALLTGCYGPAGNDALFRRANTLLTGRGAPTSLPDWFRKAGYETVSVGKVSHHPGGLGGPDWNEASEPEMPGAWDRARMPCGPWRHPRGAMHGLANGEIRGPKAGTMAVFQSADVPDTGYPDGRITGAGIEEIATLAKGDKPFLLAVGLIRPHLPFGAPATYYEPYRDLELPPIPHPSKPEGRTTWHGSGEFRRYDLGGRDPNRDAAFADEVRRHYAACVSYADAQVGRLLDALEKSGAAERTVVVLWGDHGWHLGEHAVWGKHTLFEESLRSPLIVRAPGVREPGRPRDGIVESIDLFPTLCDLAGIEAPAEVDGRSLRPLLEDAAAEGHDAVSYDGGAATLRTPDLRLVLHRKDGFAELYDHRDAPGESRNVADDHPDLVRTLGLRLDERLGKR